MRAGWRRDQWSGWASRLLALLLVIVSGVGCCFIFLLAFLLASPPAAWAAGPRVQVRGTSRLDVRAAGAPERIQISGTLRDETGTPISDALLVVTPMADATVPVAWAGVGPCSEAGPLSRAGQEDLTVTTDSVGGFCLLAALARSEAAIRVVYGGGALHEGTRTQVLWNALQRPLSVRFAPRPERIDLDAPRVLIFARVAAPAGVSKHDLPLHLTAQDGQALASAQTDESGAAHFDFPSSALPGPGIGVLNLTFPGQQDLAGDTATATVTRSVRVHLAAEQHDVRGNPARGIPIRVRAHTSRGPAQGGTVEATLNHAVAGAGPVVDGVAQVMLSFRPRRDDPSHTVRLRYRPDAPYHEPSSSISVAVIAEQPSPWLRGVPVLLGVLVGAWLLRGWWRPKRRDRAITPQPPLRGEPSLQVIGASPSRDGWTGRIVDAHDGEPVARARVLVLAPTFVELDIVAEQATDADGAFALQVHSSEKELRLRVEAKYHAQMERPLPPPSELVIALVSRRRMLLERLVRWARREGKPWYQAPEPTPGHVAQVARARRRRGETVAAWAEGVERGAYGPEPVDHESEREVQELEPRGQPLR